MAAYSENVMEVEAPGSFIKVLGAAVTPKHSELKDHPGSAAGFWFSIAWILAVAIGCFLSLI